MPPPFQVGHRFHDRPAHVAEAKPELAPGRNEIRWTALSADGHVIEGSLIIVLRAMARPGA